MVIGGDKENKYLSSVEIFDPNDNKWIPGNDLPVAVSRPAIFKFNRIVFLIGGDIMNGQQNKIIYSLLCPLCEWKSFIEMDVVFSSVGVAPAIITESHVFTGCNR